MSTNDVPGANPDHADKLSRGCWAEAADSQDHSLIFVKDLDENDRVIFEVYDLSDPGDPVYYPYALPKTDFEDQFSYSAPSKNKKKAKVDVKWIWHDKTPFDWGKIMKNISTPKPVKANVSSFLSAAKRVAESLKARALHLDKNHVDDVAGNGAVVRATNHIMSAVKKAMEELKDEGTDG